jgi:hypothetical protein
MGTNVALVVHQPPRATKVTSEGILVALVKGHPQSATKTPFDRHV